jgi:4-aminobutyrate aminotransferase/(S)-3-amino-2-methylpropionate transaminase
MTMSVTGLDFWRTDPWPDPHVVFAPAPHCYRCPLNKTFGSCDIACATTLDARIRACEETPAAMILEIVQGNGGIVVPPPEYFERLKAILAAHDMLLIVDEVQTGFGRTGRLFASQHFGLEPDIMTVAKALGGGLPVAAAMATDAVAQTFNGPRASTFGGNLVTMRGGLTVLKAIQERGLVENAAELGTTLKENLLTLKEKHAVIGDVRGLGLMVGAELVAPDKTPATSATDIVLERMKERGILLGKTGAGRNVLTFQPPLIVTKDHINTACSTLDEVLSTPLEA